MNLLADGKVIIEVGLNEAASKAENPHVPYGPDEVARDAIACAAAGASIIHFHARFDDGEQAKTDDAIYRKAMELIAEESGVLTWPTAFPLNGRPSDASQLPHHWALVDKPPKGAPLKIGAFDAWRIGRRPFIDPSSGRLTPALVDGFGPRGGEYNLPEVLTTMLDYGLLPTICCYELGDVRWTRKVVEAGLLPTPVRIEVLLYENWIYGPSATPRGVDAFLGEWDAAIDAELTVVPYGISSRGAYEALLRHSLERGVNIRVGVGDCPTAIVGATNAQLVEWAVQIAASYGLAPASSSEVRNRLNLVEA